MLECLLHGRPRSSPATHLGLTLSGKASAQHVHGLHGQGGGAGRQAATHKVHGEVAGIVRGGSVHQLGQQLERQKLQEQRDKVIDKQSPRPTEGLSGQSPGATPN